MYVAQGLVPVRDAREELFDSVRPERAQPTKSPVCQKNQVHAVFGETI